MNGHSSTVLVSPGAAYDLGQEVERLLSGDEQMEPLAALANAVGVERTTTWRWATVGCRGVKLAYVQQGGRRYSSRGALKRFFAELTRRSTGSRGQAVSAPALSAARQRELDRVDRELAARLGL